MRINGLTAYDYKTEGGDLSLVLGCTADEALAMDVSIIEVRTDAGDLVETFTGYVKRSVTIDAVTEYVTVLCCHETDGTAAAINALGGKVAALGKQNDETAAVLATLLGGEQ